MALHHHHDITEIRAQSMLGCTLNQLRGLVRLGHLTLWLVGHHQFYARLELLDIHPGTNLPLKTRQGTGVPLAGLVVGSGSSSNDFKAASKLSLSAGDSAGCISREDTIGFLGGCESCLG